MKLSNYELNLPSYAIGDDIYHLINEKCPPIGKKILIVGGQKAMKAANDKIKEAIKDSELTIIGELLYGSDCTYQTVEKLFNNPLFQEADMVFGVGGGKAIDTCKCLCDMHHKPLFTFPTIASNCAGCTSVSIMYNDDGTFFKPHFFLKPALFTFIDTQIIANAPSIYLWAGIGDTYAKYYEASISSRDEKLEHYTRLGLLTSKDCLDALMEYGQLAYQDNQNHIVSKALEETVLTIVVTTGIASIFLTRDFTPDYNSGLAHAVFYALTQYKVIEEKHLHGEVVGFGVLFALLVDKQYDEFKRIYQFNKSIHLPTSLKEIDITDEQFDETMNRIGQMSDVAHYPYPVSKDMLIDALNELNNYD